MLALMTVWTKREVVQLYISVFVWGGVGNRGGSLRLAMLYPLNIQKQEMLELFFCSSIRNTYTNEANILKQRFPCLGHHCSCPPSSCAVVGLSSPLNNLALCYFVVNVCFFSFLRSCYWILILSRQFFWIFRRLAPKCKGSLLRGIHHVL